MGDTCSVDKVEFGRPFSSSFYITWHSSRAASWYRSKWVLLNLSWTSGAIVKAFPSNMCIYVYATNVSATETADIYHKAIQYFE